MPALLSLVCGSFYPPSDRDFPFIEHEEEEALLLWKNPDMMSQCVML